MSTNNEEFKYPKQVVDNATMAEEFIGRLNEPDPEEETEELEVTEETTEEIPVEEDEEPSFRERYLTLKGKYDAEVPRLSSELKQLKQSVFDRLGQMTPAPKEEPAATEEDPIIAQFREEFGDDHANLMLKLIDARGRETLKTEMKPVQEKVQSVEEAQLNAARDDFARILDTKVEQGKWRELWEGRDPKFGEFLASPDPSGLYTYGELVKLYSDKWDADRLSKVFNTYLGQTPQAPQAKPNKEKEALIAPSRSTTTTPPVGTEAVIWTTASIRQFEKDDRAGKITPEESARLWNDLLLAPAENRIR
jgi:hypothetical protein